MSIPEGGDRRHSAQQDTRLADIQTSLAVLASSAQQRDAQIDKLSKTLEAHMHHEERMFEKINDKTNKLERRMDRAEGAVNGARWLIAIISGVAGVLIFLGFKH